MPRHAQERSPQARDVIVLAKVDGLSHAEIAVRLGITQSATIQFSSRRCAGWRGRSGYTDGGSDPQSLRIRGISPYDARDLGKPGGRVLDRAVAEFLRDVVRSVWALELMLLMLRDPARPWSAHEITAEMRASLPLVTSILDQYQRTGLVARDGDVWRWSPRDERLKTLAARVAQAQATTPLAVIKAISAEPKGPLRAFADAFRFKGD